MPNMCLKLWYSVTFKSVKCLELSYGTKNLDW